MKSRRLLIVLTLLALLIPVFARACATAPADSQIKIISWRCQREAPSIVCTLRARNRAPEEFTSLLRPVFLDESGKVVNTCEACAQRNGGRQANADDGEKKEDIIMVFALTSDSSLYNVMTTVTDKPEIKRYKFYFTDAASDKPVSNTVEGEVFVHE